MIETTTQPNSPVTIVTSNASKSNYNDNVNTLNSANNALKQTSSNNPSVVDFLTLNGQPSDYASRAKMAASQGINNYVGNAEQNTQLLNTLRSGTNGGNNNTNNNGGTGTGNVNKEPPVDTNAPKITAMNTVTNSDGSSTVTNSDGSSIINYSDGTTYNIPKGLDPTIAKLQSDNIRTVSKLADDTKIIMDKLNTYDPSNDPAAIAAANNIKSQFDVLIKQMQDKNALLAGSYAKNSARSGMLQYANEMDTNFKSEELDKANGRVSDLIQKENDAIAKSNAAYKSGNVKALEAATKEYQQTLTDKTKAIMDFSKLVNDQVKQNATDLKQANADLRNNMLDSIKFATANAPDIAEQIKDIKDPAQIEKIYNDSSDTLGIDPGILKSAVETELRKTKKEDLANAHTEAITNKLLNPAASKGTQSEREAETVTNYNNLFVPGAKLKDGTPLLDPDGYITPVAWKAAIKEAPSKGLTRAKFIKEFGSQIYSNGGEVPASYGLTSVEKKLITGVNSQ